ncbi:MAG TPA: hypothetical protein VIX18_04240 [Nitrospirota bacterium]
MRSLTDCLEQYALIALEKQDKLEFLIGEHTYELNLDAGKIRFNDDLEFPLQLLGTESDNTLSWLWAWSDEQIEMPGELLRAAQQLRDWGTREGLTEFTVPSVDLDAADGHVLAMISTEISGASCYYRDAYEGGAAFILLFDKRIDSQPSFDPARLSRRFPDLASRYDFNHRNALLSYLRIKGLSPTETDGLIIAALESGESLSARFDRNGRLIELNDEPIAG